MQLSSLQTLALSKLIESKALKAARGEVTPGDYEVDLAVRAVVNLTVNEDTDTAGTVRVDDVLSLVETIVTNLHGEEAAEEVMARVDRGIRKRKAVRQPRKGTVKAFTKLTEVTLMTAGETALVGTAPTPVTEKNEEVASK